MVGVTRLRAERATFSVVVQVIDGPVCSIVGDRRRMKVDRLHYERDLQTGDESLAATGNPTTGLRGPNESVAVIDDEQRADWLAFCRMVAAGGRPSGEHTTGEAS